VQLVTAREELERAAKLAKLRGQVHREALHTYHDVGATLRSVRDAARSVVLGGVERARILWGLASTPLALASASPLSAAVKAVTLAYLLKRSGSMVDALRDAALTLQLLLEEVEGG
jgi:hypothetical protein